MIKKFHTQRGFTLLLAALIASVVLALGSSIFNIARKQVTLSSLGRESQFAFYAADTGAECALYWDVRFDAFGVAVPLTAPTCDGKALNETVTAGNRSAAPYTMSFQIDMFVNADGIAGNGDDNGYCTSVSVQKRETSPFTVIRSDGYSTSCALKDSSARSLQRSVVLQY